MSSLRIIEKDCFEKLFDMSGGYVLDFTNQSFRDFFQESASLDIYAEKYAINGDSKARRLRSFIALESDSRVGKTLADLLEYWQYTNPHPTAEQIALADHAHKAISRLLGRDLKSQDSAEEFLKLNFGDVSFIKIPNIGSTGPILEARFSEAVRCLKANSPLAVIFHCGGILEGLLLGVACANPQQFNQASNCPKDKAGTVKKFHEWTLAQFIDVACELGYLGLDIKKFSHALRDFRNYIHPYAQMSSGFTPDRHTAEICLQVLKAAIVSLSGGRKP